MVKLIIQIPCLNEAQTLPQTIRDLPKQIDGIDVIEYQVIDDGSTDDTAEVARKNGVHHIISLGTNRGLATAFSVGINNALKNGADIVVNTDADNQYCGADICKLVRPIIENKAEIVVGCRPIVNHPEFSSAKKFLQLVGSSALRWISKTDVPDAPSGFRAFSRRACQRIFIHSKFSYCMETLIQAGTTGMRVASVDIRINPKTRDSRLFKSIPQYIMKTGGTMLHMFILYRPGRFFFLCSIPFFLGAFFIGIRFLYLVYFTERTTRTYIPSLIFLSLLASAAFLFCVMAVIGILMQANRRLLEESLFLIKSNHDKIAPEHTSIPAESVQNKNQ